MSCLQIWHLEKDPLLFMQVSGQESIVSTSDKPQRRNGLLKGLEGKTIVPKCQCHERQKTDCKCFRLKETKES